MRSLLLAFLASALLGANPALAAWFVGDAATGTWSAGGFQVTGNDATVGDGADSLGEDTGFAGGVARTTTRRVDITPSTIDVLLEFHKTECSFACGRSTIFSQFFVTISDLDFLLAD